jgi:hypothetical protein
MSSKPIHDWFELTYANYLVIPRSLLQGMPVEWQERMVQLLEEMRETYDTSKLNENYTVKLRGDDGRFVSDPLSYYRYPPPLPYRNRE